MSEFKMENFLDGISEEDLKTLFPEGRDDAPAAYLRMKAYMPCTNAANMMAAIRDNRDSPEFQKGVGHKRGAWMVCLAIAVSAVRHKGTRELTDRMDIMIDETFDEDFRAEFLSLMLAPQSSILIWRKDGGSVRLNVAAAILDDPGLVSWAGTPWAPMRND